MEPEVTLTNSGDAVVWITNALHYQYPSNFYTTNLAESFYIESMKSSLEFPWLLIPWVIGFFVMLYLAASFIGKVAYCFYNEINKKKRK